MKLLIKRTSALMLAVSFFLPLAQCSRTLGDTASPVTLSASHAYAWPGLLSLVALLLFFWPLAIQLWRAMKRSSLPSRKVPWLEFGLSVSSLAGICCLVVPWLVDLGASIRYGAYVACGSVLAYGIVSFIEAMKGGPRPEGYARVGLRLPA